MFDHERLRARLPGWTAAAFSLALLLPLTVPLLRGRVFIFDDLSNFHLPVRYLYANALRSGDSILWTPALFSGFYLHGEGQVGMFHPLHLLLYATLPLTTAFNLELVFNYVFAFAGMFLFLRRLLLSPGAAAGGAMLFAFSGFQLLHFHHMNLVGVTAHLPWLLLTLDRLMTAETPRSRAQAYIGPVLVIASALLLGFPQGVWWILLAASAFMLLRARDLGWRALVPCAMSIATGVMLGGIQLLPTLDVAAHSTRTQVPPDFALSFSLHPLNTLQLWAPYVLERRVYSPVDHPFVHEFGIYSGALGLLAPLWLWIRRDALGRYRTLVFWTAVFAAIMFVLALGRYGGLDILLTKLPGLGSLRAPARYIVLVQFALAVLSAVALDDLIAREPGGLRLPRSAIALLCMPALLSIVTTLAVNTGALSLGRSVTPATLAVAAAGPALIAAITAALLGAARTRLLFPLLIALAAIDLHHWGISYVNEARPQSIGSLTGLAPVPIPGARYDWSGDWADRPILKGHQLAWGYAGLFPATKLSIDDVAFQRLAGVRGFVASDASVIPIAGAAERVTLAGGSGGGTATLVRDRPGHIVVRTATPDQQRLSLTERFDEGWTARIDGRERLPLWALRGDFIACVVPAGVHRIEFRFMPRSFVLGSVLSGAGALLAAAGALVISRSRA